jgi:hypothetical protein
MRPVAHITIILFVVYGCQPWSFTLREEHRLRVFESRVLKKIFGSKEGEVTGSREDYITRSFFILNSHKILFG